MENNHVYPNDPIYLAPDEETVSKPDMRVEDRKIEPPAASAMDISKPVFAVSEITELREENRQVFRMSDGTEQAVFYSEAVHALNDETQTYKEVDNTLIEEEDGRHFRNRHNRFVARFSREETNDELFSVEKGMHRLSISVKKTRKQLNQGVVPRLQKVRKSLSDTTFNDTLVFGDVVSGADMEYSIRNNGVKENIIVKEKAVVYRYPFILECENIIADYHEDERKVVFADPETGHEVFCIPSPFMSDANGVTSTGVFYEMKPLSEGKFSFTVTADSEWMNAEERAFPVTIDPQVTVSGTDWMTTYGWKEGEMNRFGTVGGYYYVNAKIKEDGSCSASRMYMNLTIPTLPQNARIKKVELQLEQFSAQSNSNNYPNIGLYKVTSSIQTGHCTPYHNSYPIDYAKIHQNIHGHYTFDITSVFDSFSKGETSYPNLVLKMVDEDSVAKHGDTAVICGCEDATTAPKLIITYESSYGVNTSDRTHTHELGRFGVGSIDLQCGNLMFESEDFTWGGNRMPVTIKHLYNSALASYQYTGNNSIQLKTADFGAMKIGLGWKLNIMQSMVATTFQHEGVQYSGYVYIGENGDETYFKQKPPAEGETTDSNLYVDINDSDMEYDSSSRTLTMGGEMYLFDTSGRLIRITDEYNNHMDITYTSDRITSVTDGAGRDFSFAYATTGRLTSITAPDGSSIRYTYGSNDTLSTVTYPDGRKAEITYSSFKPYTVILKNASNTPVYKVTYSSSNNRIYLVSEYGYQNGAYVIGPKTRYSFSAASRRTTVTTTEPKDTGEFKDNVIKTVYTFDDDGSIISEYAISDDTGSVGVEGEGSGINPYAGDGVGIIRSSCNLLQNHNFHGSSNWTKTDTSKVHTEYHTGMDANTQYSSSLYQIFFSDANAVAAGIYQTTDTLSAGEYTFSVYASSSPIFSAYNGKAYIRVTKTNGTLLSESEHISGSCGFTRLVAPFTLTSDMPVRVYICMDGNGYMSVNAAQLERNPYASDYNMLDNGHFERSLSNWTTTSQGVSTTTATKFNMSRSLYMNGDLDSERYACQKINVKSSQGTRETFTLSGWAKGYGIVDRERNGCKKPQFRLRAVIQYENESRAEGDPIDPEDIEEYTANFSPCTEEWQFASVQFAKQKYRVVESMKVYCDYSYNCGAAYFDDIQLTRDSVELRLSESDFDTGDADSATDTGTSTNTEENTAPSFEELKDAFGNALTETTFTDGEFGTVYRAFGYNPACNDVEDAGNDLICETDARGNKTSYTVDCETSRNEEVTDRCGNKTAYEYDAAGRTTKVISKKANGSTIAHVSYAYDAFDNLTEITRGDGMKYSLVYNAFHKLDSIGVAGKTEKLVSYAYKNGNGRLKKITYANGDSMGATYNSMGQLVAEKWCDSKVCVNAHYKYVYDCHGNIVRSIDMGQKCEYTYTYEDDKIVQASEYTITVGGNEIITGKTLVNTIAYTYDADGNLTKKQVKPASGSEQVYYYENPENENPVVKFTAGGQTVTSHSKNDSFGRKVFDELQLGKGFISRQFHYHAGKATTEHTTHDKLKSSPTTQLVSEIVLSDGRTLQYEYDAEERITKVVDSVDGTTTYTYDALGQLLTETVNGTVVNTMTYDNYGNILTKGSNTYTYGDSVWKDRLTAYNGQTITYDKQGNPTSYRGYTLKWEKGRQLKSFGSNSYTYNANGIRTSKTINGVRHTYLLDGTRILRETWGSNTLIPLYDNEDDVCGILYNSTPYYFMKNLQGDVVAITYSNGAVAARYSYDAWGVCTITKDYTTIKIATINPFRYRGYYYDAEIGLYYLQSRYYDPTLGRFVNADDSEVACLETHALSSNLYSYCKNSFVDSQDESGMFSFNDLFKKISGFLNKLFNKFINNLKKQIQITKKYIKISVNAIKLILNIVITLVVSKVLKWGIEKIIGFVMKKYIQKNTKSFVQFLGKVLNHGATKWLIKALMLRAVNLGYIRSVTTNIKNVAIDSVLSVSTVLSKINSICSAFSSISGFIAFILDLADRKWDDYLTIKLA